jgi:hypothetical protein
MERHQAHAVGGGGLVGVAQHGRVTVMWDRPAQRYDVGTAARSHAQGRRREVLPALAALLNEA